ncbi:MAG TPA: protein-L-isoaspartate(D-aspartate) O-methyltransferase [Anaerolineaceae bacterium]|nr:protein-L-isoaspartate(D-aspartate) O-methyltransferase [Anaerolineaceae bacterium]
MTELEAERRRMVDEQIFQRGVRDPAVLEAMLTVPRHEFVPPHLREFAYDDGPLPIGHRQTISQPYIVAYMTSLLKLTGEERVLEVGTGSGYQAAVLSNLAAEVHTIEQHADLVAAAAQRLARLGIDNVFLHAGDGSLGWPPEAPYEGILVTAAAPDPPPALLEQLADGSRLVIPVGGRRGQWLQVWRRRGTDFDVRSYGAVAFVPLRGAGGWTEEEWGERRRTRR